MDAQGITVGSTFQDGDERTVTVARVWTDAAGTGVGFDIYGTDLHGRPVTSHSAMDIGLFIDVYMPPTSA